MLDMISNGFKKATEELTGRSKLTEENLAPALEEIRRSLLDADVEYSVVKTFLKNVKEASLGESVQIRAGKGEKKVKVSAREHFIKICQDKLEDLMGPVDTGLSLPKGKIATVMMVGLQGSGKTTSTGKLALFLKSNEKRKPLLVAADIYRPAAVDQLEVLGQRLSLPVFHIKNTSPQEICRLASDKARELGCDTVLLDTAGRLTIDEKLMTELTDIRSLVKPDHIFFVCDAMMGQDAVTTAKAFHEKLDLSGVIMTKLDGDARGGAALSIKEVTGAPIKFLGMGEELEALEEFRPDGLASRILGMGDVVGLMQDFEKVASDDHEENAERALAGKFNFQDFYSQIETIQKMGSLKDVMAKLPMQNMLPAGAMDQVDESRLGHIRSMINSMTRKERLDPDLLNSSRITRIAKGSGTKMSDVQQLVKQVKQMRTLFGQLGGGMLGGMMQKIPGMKELSQMSQMRKLAQTGNPFGGAMSQLGGAASPGMKLSKRIDRSKVKKARQAAKNNRKRKRK